MPLQSSFIACVDRLQCDDTIITAKLVCVLHRMIVLIVFGTTLFECTSAAYIKVKTIMNHYLLIN